MTAAVVSLENSARARDNYVPVDADRYPLDYSSVPENVKATFQDIKEIPTLIKQRANKAGLKRDKTGKLGKSGKLDKVGKLGKVGKVYKVSKKAGKAGQVGKLPTDKPMKKPNKSDLNKDAKQFQKKLDKAFHTPKKDNK